MRDGIIKLTGWGHSGQGHAMPAQGSAIAPIRDEGVRRADVAGRGPRGARINGMTGARVFSYPVSTIFNGKEVTATMETAVDGEQKIGYYCHAHGFDVGAGDFVWGPEALAFKEASGIEHGGEGQLDEEMAKAFMDEMDIEVMKEQA